MVALTAALLGTLLVRRGPGGRAVIGRVVEAEAYGGAGVDPSAHSFRGPTPRCAVMFGPAGHAYVYATQGRCHCLNVTAEGDGNGRAVLLRALQPLTGLDVMRRRRLARLDEGPTRRRLLSGADHELARGPGRLCLCLDVDRRLDGVDLTDGGGPLYLAADGHGGRAPSAAAGRRRAAAGRDARRTPPGPVLWTPRVGLNPASASCEWRWRAFLPGVAAVSPGGGAEPARRPRPARCPPAR